MLVALVLFVLIAATLFSWLCAFTHSWNARFKQVPDPKVSRYWAAWWFKWSFVLSVATFVLGKLTRF